MFDLNGRRAFVAGHRGMVGSALLRKLTARGCETVIVGREALDLRRQAETEDWIAEQKPEIVFLAAATVGGILANDTRPAEFIYDNVAIAANIIEASRRVGVKKLVFLGSSCIYPRMAPQPIPEDALLTGPLEPTNQWYAVAKIAGLKMCAAYRAQYGCDFVSVMPTNLYGPGDTYDLQASHVVPALIAKFNAAKMKAAPAVEIWGTGQALREFLHVDDLASAVLTVAESYSDAAPINVGSGEEVSIAALARLIAEVVGYEGRLEFNSRKPDGTPRKLVDSTRIRALGWRPRFSLRHGLEDAFMCHLGLAI